MLGAMQNSSDVRDYIGWYQKFILSCPLWVARLENEFYRDLYVIKPYKWQELENKPPAELEFNVTEFCNASCSFCCYRYSKPRNRMNNQIFLKSVQEYCNMGGKNVLLNALTGEPLLDPLIFQKLDILKSFENIEASGLTTNGILLNRDEIVESIINSGLSFIRISTSGFDRIMYEKGMGVKKYDEFLSGACKLLKRNQECGNPISIQFEIRGLINVVDTEDFSTKIFPFIKSSNGKVTMAFLRLYANWIGQVNEEDLPMNCGFQARTHIRTKPCSLSFNLGVMPNGELRLCNAQYGVKGRTDDLTLGNIETEALADVWFSETTMKVRRTTCGRNMNDICQNCNSYMPISSNR
jgi:radical SAM protein with 4Fe4S-binding SPASM domain